MATAIQLEQALQQGRGCSFLHRQHLGHPLRVLHIGRFSSLAKVSRSSSAHSFIFIPNHLGHSATQTTQPKECNTNYAAGNAHVAAVHRVLRQHNAHKHRITECNTQSTALTWLRSTGFSAMARFSICSAGLTSEQMGMCASLFLWICGEEQRER